MPQSRHPSQTLPPPNDVNLSDLLQGVFHRPEGCQFSPVGDAPVPVPVRQAVAQLIAIIDSLCSPSGGWPADKPQTPEVLLPYVSDEVAEVLEVLRHHCPSRPRLDAFADFAAYCLWAIAGSTPEAMALLEGVADPQFGMVRLVPALTLRHGEKSYCLDLVTQGAFDRAALPPKQALQLQGRSPRSVADWQDRLWQQVTAAFPDLDQWRQGGRFQALLPETPWSSVEGSLTLHFVASGQRLEVPPPATLDPSSPPADQPAPRIWLASQVLPEETTALPLESRLTFSDADWLTAAIAAHHHTSTEAALAAALTSRTSQLDALAVLQAAYQSQQAAVGENRLLSSPLTLKLLCERIQWLQLRASPALMQMMQGVSAHCLTPGSHWQPGTLAASHQLVFGDAAGVVAYLDGTGACWSTAPFDMPETAVVRLCDQSLLGQALWEQAALCARLGAYLDERSPLLAGLRQQNPITLTPPEAPLPQPFEKAQFLTVKLTLRFHAAG